MAKPEMIGSMDCVLSKCPGTMEIRNDKRGNPYGWCPDCCLQLLTHGREPRTSLLLAQMTPAKPATPATPAPTEAKPVQPKPTAPPPAPAEPASKGWFL